MFKQYLPCTVKWRHCFDVIEDVMVKLYTSYVCRKQIVGDAHLCQTQDS